MARRHLPAVVDLQSASVWWASSGDRTDRLRLIRMTVPMKNLYIEIVDLVSESAQLATGD